MIRVLQCVNNMHRAGLETMLMNYYRNIDRSQIQFDFLTHRPERSDYDREIEELGGHVYYAPRLYPQNIPAYFRWMKNFFKEHPEYKIMHSHIDAMSYFPLLAGKMNGVPVRIAHSHNTSIDRDFKYVLKQICRRRIDRAATHRLSCGEEAGQFLFRGKSFEVIPNAVDAEKFYFDPILREKKRKELGLHNEFTVGHVGRAYSQKNHRFLVDIFRCIHNIEPDSVLLMVGTGEKTDEIKAYVKKLDLEASVRFLGSRTDVNELYQAMDAFVLPSLFEGVPLVGVEAQFSDLPCFFSDKVPTEVKFNDKARFISLNTAPQIWAREILAGRTYQRNSRKEDIAASRYDIKTAHTLLEQFYAAVFEKIET